MGDRLKTRNQKMIIKSLLQAYDQTGYNDANTTCATDANGTKYYGKIHKLPIGTKFSFNLNGELVIIEYPK